jgi:import receptor subunit TOM20
VAQNKEPDGTTSSNSISPAELKEVLNQLKGEEPPKTAEERETYFMSQVGLGEQLAMQGTIAFEPY